MQGAGRRGWSPPQEVRGAALAIQPSGAALNQAGPRQSEKQPESPTSSGELEAPGSLVTFSSKEKQSVYMQNTADRSLPGGHGAGCGSRTLGAAANRIPVGGWGSGREVFTFPLYLWSWSFWPTQSLWSPLDPKGEGHQLWKQTSQVQLLTHFLQPSKYHTESNQRVLLSRRELAHCLYCSLAG